ncbi:conserved Plasmodium protein, unknown function [Plasmodium gallinaceum]|uniref:Uncharacterized protein n=1 Tax=Plasmodium gallinaceum TaxID=5849 RepID=A0A1J1GT41_PLAGA|nr:conserved Plasmodium protein, unknown function [Plasmodium gallinaceum]CRG95650.1 conserved Plasmodium protein, unknown function [Plasmodium gallinaceum]
MSNLKKKNKNLLESLTNEDIINLIKKCYKDKLIYGYVKWKELNKKQFSRRYSVNTFKNIWRIINKNFDNYSKEYEGIIKEIEVEAKDIISKNNKLRINKKLDILFPLKSRISISNISLLRNFSRVNSFFFKCCSNYYSPLNGFLSSRNRNFIRDSKSLKDNENDIKKVNYIKRNIVDIRRQSEFLDYYFLVISLIHQGKKFALLKKMGELYENKLLKCCNNKNYVYNSYILNFIKKIHEISLVTSNIKSISKLFTQNLEKNFGSKFIDSKNITTIETNENSYHFNKSLTNYKIFYNIFKNNINLNNNKAISFIIPLPKKPNHLTFKNNNFYYFEDPVYLNNNLDEDIYNYIYIFHKFFLSFLFWSFYLKYQGIEKMKILFNKELEELNSFIDTNNMKKEEIIEQKKNYNKSNMYAFMFDFKIDHIISLCLYVFKIYLKNKRKIDLNYLRVIKILNLSLHPTLKKKIIRCYIITIRYVYDIVLKLISKYRKKKKKQ